MVVMMKMNRGGWKMMDPPGEGGSRFDRLARRTRPIGGDESAAATASSSWPTFYSLTTKIHRPPKIHRQPTDPRPYPPREITTDSACSSSHIH